MGGGSGDSGWVTLAITGSFTAVTSGGYPAPSVRKVGKVVHMRGLVQFVSGSYTNTITTLPGSYCPPANEANPAFATSGKVFQTSVNAAGAVAVMPQPTYTVGSAAAGDVYSLYGSGLVA